MSLIHKYAPRTQERKKSSQIPGNDIVILFKREDDYITKFPKSVVKKFTL